MLTFICNICSATCHAESLDREQPSCDRCGSNVRFRWIVHTLSTELFNESLPLKKFPTRKKVHGIGMSDPISIATVLAKRFNYRNTTLDRKPQFDIMAPAHPDYNAFDFVVTSEVLEHVRPPVQTAFDNLSKILKPGGFAVLSTPWEIKGDTIEHFPNLHDWQLVKLHSGYVVVNRTANGHLETFEDLTFHDGPGSILEMRVFSKSGLLANCQAAGFFGIDFAEDYPPFGIVWDKWSRGLILRKTQARAR